MGPPLRFERTTLITGSVPLIRLASLGTFPQGKARAGRGPPLRRITERMRSFRRGRSQTGPRAAQCAAPTDLIRLALLGTFP